MSFLNVLKFSLSRSLSPPLAENVSFIFLAKSSHVEESFANKDTFPFSCFICMGSVCVHACYAPCDMSDARGGQERASDFLGLKS